ncbi:MAG TPA: Gldg family protein, partial [Planctomycetota bacterium]|nr:Gldg family protein [Planctomycetota bacterium]
MAVKEGGLDARARFGIGVNVVLICALAAALVALLLALTARAAYRFDLRADLTRSAKFTLDPASEETLRGIERDVEIRFAFGRDEDIRRRTVDATGQPRDQIYLAHYRPLVEEIAHRVRTTLAEWRAVTPRVSVEVVDADQNPRRLNEWATERGRRQDDLVNRIWMRSGDAERVVALDQVVGVEWGHFPRNPAEPPTPPRIDRRWRIQNELTRALRGVSAGELTPLWMAAGKRSRLEPGDAAFEPFAALLRSQGFDPRPWKLEDGAPTGGILLLAAPAAPLTRVEADAVVAYEAAGGRLFVAADPRHAEDFAAVLAPYGLRFAAQRLEDAQHAPSPAEPWVLRSAGVFLGGHEVVRGFAGRTPLVLGHVKPIVDEGVRAPGAVREPILRASSAATGVPADFDPARGEAAFLVAGKTALPGALLGLACERPLRTGGRSRALVIGSGEAIDVRAIQAGLQLANRELLLNALNWLSERTTFAGAVEADEPGARIDLGPPVLDAA